MSDKYTCKRCSKGFDNYESLRRHVGRIHKIHSITFHVEFNLDGVWPLCKCGCNQKVKWGAFEKKFRDYCQGHQSRVNNNWGHNPKAIEASSKTRREQFDKGERKVWNAGLSEFDQRVKNNLINLKVVVKSEPHRKMRSRRMKEDRLNGTVPTLFGKDHPNWRGGVSSIQQIARASTTLYKDWKYPILVRDGFKCTKCPNFKDLHVHHDEDTFSDIIKKVMTIDDFENIEYFDRKKEISERVVQYHIINKIHGITLCKDCHGELHPSLNF